MSMRAVVVRPAPTTVTCRTSNAPAANAIAPTEITSAALTRSATSGLAAMRLATRRRTRNGARRSTDRIHRQTETSERCRRARAALTSLPRRRHVAELTDGAHFWLETGTTGREHAPPNFGDHREHVLCTSTRVND